MSLQTRLHSTKRRNNRGEGLVHTAGQIKAGASEGAKSRPRHTLGFFSVYSASKQEVPNNLRRVVNDLRLPLC